MTSKLKSYNINGEILNFLEIYQFKNISQNAENYKFAGKELINLLNFK